jgi:hypothetical protein
MKTEQRGLLWRFIGSIAAITFTVGLATLVAYWTGPLN